MKWLAVILLLLVPLSIRAAHATEPAKIDLSTLYLEGVPLCTEEQMAIDFDSKTPPDHDAPALCQAPIELEEDFKAPQWLRDSPNILREFPPEAPVPTPTTVLTMTKASGIDAPNAEVDYAVAVFNCGGTCSPLSHAPTAIDAFITAATPSLDWGLGLQNWNNYKFAPRIHAGPFVELGSQCNEEFGSSGGAPYENGMIGIVHGTTFDGVVSDGTYRLIVERFKDPCYADVITSVSIPNNHGIWVSMFSTLVSGNWHLIARYWNGSNWIIVLNIQDSVMSWIDLGHEARASYSDTWAMNQPLVSIRNIRLFDWTGVDHPYRHLDLPTQWQGRTTVFDSGSDVDLLDPVGGSWLSLSAAMD